jgi:Uma2 family endonuclease
MAMPAPAPVPSPAGRRWTAAEVRELNDSAPEGAPSYELVAGELLVTPSPVGPHQRVVRELMFALTAWLREHPVGDVFDSLDVELEPHSLVRPDVLVVPPDEAVRLETEMPARALILVAEVLSPSTARVDRGPKRVLYQRHAPEYWIVDLDSELIERWRLADERPEILHDRITWTPEGAQSMFELELRELFLRRE